MHTKIGRKMGMTRKDFGMEGSKVVNEENNYLNKTYLKIYLLFKDQELSELDKKYVSAIPKIPKISKQSIKKNVPV